MAAAERVPVRDDGFDISFFGEFEGQSGDDRK
jgi:hypothetical protein